MRERASARGALISQFDTQRMHHTAARRLLMRSLFVTLAALHFHVLVTEAAFQPAFSRIYTEKSRGIVKLQTESELAVIFCDVM